MSIIQPRQKIAGIKHIIAVVNGKGGVGKSFVTANLACSLAKLGKKTGLLDADISCPNDFQILGITKKLTPTADQKLMPAEAYGVKIISMTGLSKTDDEAIIWRGPIISKIIQQLLKETLWGELDFLVVDFPSSANDVALTLLQQVEIAGALIVTTPQKLALLDAKRTANMLTMLEIPIWGVIENMRGETFGEGGGSMLSSAIGAPLLGSIPLKKQIIASCDEGKPAIMTIPEVDFVFSKMARALVEKVAR